jgi:AraC-like DNA-binding protein
MEKPTRTEIFTLSWLLAPDENELVLNRDDPDLERIPYALPKEQGEAWLDSLAFPDGIVFYRAVHAMEPSPRGQLIPLMEVDGRAEERAFNAQIWLSGVGCHQEYWHGRNAPPVEIVVFPGHDTFRHKQDWQAKVLVEGGVTSEMKSLIVPDSVMNTLLGEETVVELLDGLGLNAHCQAVVRPVPLHISAPFREAVSPALQGRLRRLHAQSKVLEYLCLLAGHIASPAAVPTVRRDRIRDLYDYLLEHEGKLPTLSELGALFGMSARWLNQKFTETYGQPIYAFITERRLTAAHTALRETTVPIKTLAHRLGYSHVNHFTAAFRKKFGYPPGALRQNVQVD